MKKFIFKIGLFIAIVAVSFVYLYGKRGSFYVDKFTSISSTFDIITLGTSHGGGIKFYNNNGKGFQRAGNTLYYDLQNYKFVKPHLNPEAVVVIPLSYFSFGLDENRTDYQDPNAFVNEFYFYLPSSSIYNYSVTKNIQVYLNKVKQNYNSIIKGLLKNTKASNSHEPKLTKAEQLKFHAEKRAKTHQRMGTFSTPEKNIKYLNELITDIKKSGYKPILITTPYNRFYNANFSDSWLKQYYYNPIDIILSTHNIPYIDYSHDQRFEAKDELFHNSDHFNKIGAKYFSNIFF